MCVYVGSSVIPTEQMIFFFFALGEFAGATGVAFVSFVGMESVLDKSLFQDPLADSKMELKMNSHIVAGIMTGEKKDGFSDQIIYTLENLQVCDDVSTGPPLPIPTGLNSHF